MRRSWSEYIARCAMLFGMIGSFVTSSEAQLIHREGFNDDGSGVRYVLEGGGKEINADGPAMWEHSFNVDRVGLTASAPARRAGILWSHDEDPSTWSDQAMQVWDSLIAWAMDGKAGANIGIFQSTVPFSNEALADRFRASGHTITEVFAAEDIAGANIDLLIHTNEAAPTPPTAFSDLSIPVIAFQAGNHDDTLIAKIGESLNFFDSVQANVVSANQGHPVLGGLTGSFPWTLDAAFGTLETMGAPAPGAKTLFTVEHPVTGEQIPGLIVVETGASLIGAFAPTPEGAGYLVGADLNAAFGGAVIPRAVELNPVDVSGKADVKFSVKLASADADFEAGGADDFIRVMIDPTNSGTFQVLDEFWGSPSKALASQQGNGVELNPTSFIDFEYAVPANATQLVIRFEASSTFPNEILAIDDIRIYSGSIGPVGDFNGNGVLDAADIDELSAVIRNGGGDTTFDLTSDGIVSNADRLNWIKTQRKTWVGDANLDGEFSSADFVFVFTAGKYETGVAAGWSEGDWNGDGLFSSSDFVAAFTDGGYEAGPVASVSAVPEPATVSLLFFGLASLAHFRRKVA
jgi:hypothetical protein